MQAELQKATFDVAGLLVMAVDFKSQMLDHSPFEEAWKHLLKISTFRFYCPIPYWKLGLKFNWDRKFDESLALLDKTVYDTIKERRLSLEQQKDDDTLDILTAFLNQDPNMSDKHIRNQLVTLLFAGMYSLLVIHYTETNFIL